MPQISLKDYKPPPPENTFKFHQQIKPTPQPTEWEQTQETFQYLAWATLML